MDERWPTSGIPTSFYSQQKAEVERMLDDVEVLHTGTRVVRMRTSLVFAGRAASEIARLFLGPLAPVRAIGRPLLPLVPSHRRLVFQAVHADDAAEAYRLAVRADVGGAFNVAADPVLSAADLARVLHAWRLPVYPRLLRAAAHASYAARLQPTAPGWVDLAFGVPTMAVDRVHRGLGWSATRSVSAALEDLLRGFAGGTGVPTAPLEPKGSHARLAD